MRWRMKGSISDARPIRPALPPSSTPSITFVMASRNSMSRLTDWTPCDPRSAAEGAGVLSLLVAVGSRIDVVAAAPGAPDPDERQEEEHAAEQPGPYEDAEHDAYDTHQQPQPGIAPPGPLQRFRVAE